MFLETLPVRKMRKCLYPPVHYFDSSSAAERVCPKCRRKHNKLLEKHGGVMTFESTPQMTRHIERVMEIEISKASSLSDNEINAFLDGDDSIDDSAVYEQIKEKPEKKKTPRTVEKVTGVSLLDIIIKEHINVKSRKVKIAEW